MRNNRVKFEFLSALIFLFVISGPVFAASSAGITPDSPFYFFDTLFERIGLFLTFNSEKKAEKTLRYMEEKTEEVRILIANNKSENLIRAMTGYERNFRLAKTSISVISDDKNAKALQERVTASVNSRHLCSGQRFLHYRHISRHC
ncbi:MAG: hypothetical protein HYS44_00655 [Candidatus Niyogibacteria bacterium]|nr:hypothetical protein [Candidatus Niyogibacteria bacterium]